MTTKTVKNDEENICLGKQGENLCTEIRFPIQEDLRDYTARLYICPGDGEGYYTDNVIQAANFLTLLVTDRETAAPGSGKMQLSFYKGNTIIKSQIYTYFVTKSIC